MKSVLLAAAALSALTFCAPALAADNATNAELDELVVTGRVASTAQRKVEASYAITTVTEEKLRLQSPPAWPRR